VDRSAHPVLVTSAAEASNTSRRVRGIHFGAILEDRAMFAGAAIVVFFTIVAIAGVWIAPHDPLQPFAGHRLSPPSREFPFGTDDFSRDVFSRVIVATRTSMLIGLSVATLTFVVGGAFGLAAGYYRFVDRVLMRFTDALIAFPAILLAIALAAVARPSIGTVVFALSVVYIPYAVRVIRATVLVNRELTYVEAARSIGARDRWILQRHVLPNSVSPLLVQAIFTFSFAILLEASLSFLGAGVPVTTPSWGNMLTSSKDYLQQAPWTLLAPGIALLAVTIGLNLLGDGVRDLLDPRHLT
jgi:peptide/nickel transport system permease protein